MSDDESTEMSDDEGTEMSDDEGAHVDVDERARAIALLEANHEFPTAYSLSVIARNAEEIAMRIAEAAFADAIEQALAAGAHERRPSAGGKYVSHRITVQVESAEHVLTLYAKLRAIDGVMSIL